MLIDELKSYNVKPAFFGLGFIQLKINDKERYHFWHEDLPGIIAEEEIHDHRYDFISEVLYGSLYQEVWDFEENYLGTHEMYEVSCDAENTVDPSYICTGDVYLTSSYELIVGSKYTMFADTFHKAKPLNGYAVTKLTRSATTKSMARVIKPKNTSHICPFSVKYSEKELWEKIESMLK